MPVYIHHSKKGPDFGWDQAKIAVLLAEVRFRQGRLLGRMAGVGSNFLAGAYSEVRAAEAEVLGGRAGRRFVELLSDMLQHYTLPLSRERLLRWHSAFRPRNGAAAHGEKRNVHLQVSITDGLDGKLTKLIHWVNSTTDIDPVVKAAVAWLWLVVIQPFDQGNEWVAALIGEMLLARANQGGERVYSVSGQLFREWREGETMLKKTGKGAADVTLWIVEFLNCMGRAIGRSEMMLEGILEKEKFWARCAGMALNERQRKMVEKLLGGEGGGRLTSSQWAALTKTSQDTAGRDINDLVRRGVLVRDAGGGRSTGYVLSE